MFAIQLANAQKVEGHGIVLGRSTGLHRRTIRNLLPGASDP